MAPAGAAPLPGALPGPAATLPGTLEEAAATEGQGQGAMGWHCHGEMGENVGKSLGIV